MAAFAPARKRRTSNKMGHGAHRSPINAACVGATSPKRTSVRFEKSGFWADDRQSGKNGDSIRFDDKKPEVRAIAFRYNSGSSPVRFVFKGNLLSINSPLRILIADDEEHSRLRIRDLLSAQTQPVSVFEAANGKATVEMIKHVQPNLLFLDVQMPAMDGFEVMRAIGPEAAPITVFVTAFDSYALRAFDASALDYLQKPFSDDRFERAFARATQRLKEIDERNFGSKIAAMLATIRGDAPYIDRIAVKGAGGVRFVKVKQIDWIEADGIYVNIHVGEVDLLHRTALVDLERQLDPLQFIRVHRAALINIDSAVSLKQRSHGEFDLFLKNGAQIKVSRLYRSRLEERLGQDL